MKITNLKVKGFRSLKDVDWHPGDLNIIIGPNASGKSNLLDLFEMLSQLPKGKLGDYIQSRGGGTALSWDGQAEGISIVLDVRSSSDAGPGAIAPLRYSLDLKPSGPFSSYQISHESLIRQDSGDECLKPLTDGGLSMPVIAVGGPSRKEESSLSGSHPLAYNGNALLFLTHIEVWRLHRIIDTSPESPVRAAPVARYEKQIENDGSNLVSVLHTLYTEDRTFSERINAAMSAAFDHFGQLVFPPSPTADQRVQMKVRWKDLSRDCPVWDLSDGTLRFLYLLAILLHPNPPSLVAIDEPETGLHPRMISIVAELAIDAATRTQLILTTHSPEFLDAFREAQPAVTVAGLEDGATELRTVSQEDLDYWLKEYTLGYIYRTGQLESMG